MKEKARKNTRSFHKKNSSWTKPQVVIMMAVLCTVLWGSAYPGVKIGYELFHMQDANVGSKLVFAGGRFILAGVFVLAYSIILNKKLILPKRAEWKGIIILGIIQTFLQYVFYYIGLSNTSGSKGAILYASGTFISVILAHFFYENDKMNKQKVIGCVLGTMGIVLINFDGIGSKDFSLTGEGFMLIGAAVFAVATIASKFVAAEQDPICLTGYQMTLGGIGLFIIGHLMNGRLKEPSSIGIVLYTYLAILSAVAFTIWTQLLKYNSVAKIAIYNSLMPIFGTILSGVFLGDTIFRWETVVATLCVAGGIYIVNKKE